MKTKKILSFILLALAVFLSGCILNVKKQPKAEPVMDGGLYFSYDKGETWQQRSMVYQIGQPSVSFGNVDVTTLVSDPEDSKAYYLGTISNGLYYTYNNGEGWWQTLVGFGRINAIAVSPSQVCTIYVAIGNRVFKTVDCTRHWEDKLIDVRNDPKNIINALAVDPNRENVIYAGTVGNAMYVSEDSGNSWSVLKFFDAPVIDIQINPKNSGIIYVATPNKGIYKTVNGGLEWQPLFKDEVVKQFKNSLNLRDFVIDPASDDGIWYASQYGLIKTQDGGATWQDIKLLTPPGESNIQSVAVNPFNDREIFYTVPGTLQKTQDGGVTWMTTALPTARLPLFLLIDQVDPNLLYLGVKKIK